MKTTTRPDAYLQQFQFQDKDHVEWNRAFDSHVRCLQIQEDLFAARSVSGVLIAIVTFGTMLGALAVGLALLFG